MRLNLDKIQAIDPQSIWLEISAADLEQTAPNPQLYANPTGVNHAQINQLCLNKLQTWLDEQKINHSLSWNTTELPARWDLVTGCAIEIGQKRVILIPNESFDRDELRVPQEWVDLPNWAGDYYLAVQVDFDANLMSFWGFAAHQTLQNNGEYAPADHSYSLDSDLLISNLDILWAATELNLADSYRLDEVTTLPLDRALELIKVLSKPSPYSPRLAIDFTEWGAIVDNSSLRSQLYQTRLQQAVIAVSPVAGFRLFDWARQEFTQAIAQGWQFSNLPSVAVMNPRHNHTIEQSKLINLQINLQQETSVVLLMGVIPEGLDRLRVLVQVHPATGSRYLPPQLQLSYVDIDGVSLHTVTARSNDNYIQLPGYTCPLGMEFNIQLQLHHARAIERFVV